MELYRKSNRIYEELFKKNPKQAYGDAVVQRLDHMLQDHDIQIEMNKQFKGYYERDGLIPKFSLEVMVLSKPFFPAIDIQNLNLPTNLQLALQTFKDFYKEIQPCQTIEFAPQLGSVTVEVQFMSRRCNITMHPSQALILLQFADGAMKSLRELEEIIELRMEEVEINTVSLMQNLPILVKAAEGTEQIGAQPEYGIGYDEQLKLNKYLRPDKIDFRVGKPIKDIIGEHSAQFARKELIDQFIVILMRTQRTMKYQDILNLAVNNITQFRPSKYDVKQRIEDLISRQFLKRKVEDRKTIEFIP
ncbi:MAG: hypothetical protein EZS28_022373 [Streblomastix strix]|uniref:Cullin family profile domain-containing protein n=1 Tax=Streblomastix strix TaxID=222440 RepID=A0A5J4VIC8_9EUKA|nr:MAG: hypothetical protein EZS28_022373 [Streblomastix strix]